MEEFQTLYRYLDIYDCKRIFDIWVDGLPPHRKPNHYDKAFLGFAKRWAKGTV